MSPLTNKFGATNLNNIYKTIKTSIDTLKTEKFVAILEKMDANFRNSATRMSYLYVNKMMSTFVLALLGYKCICSSKTGPMGVRILGA